MDDALRDFDRRANAVRKNHARLARGYVTKINKNGLIEHRPRRGRKARGPVRLVLYLILSLLAFKGFLLSELGAEDYLARVATLSQGTTVERVGSVLMSVDPATQWIADAVTLVRS